MKDQAWLKRKLQTVGKGTFVACYDVVAKNYLKADKSNIGEAIEKYGKSMGYTYARNSVITKRNVSCAIFREDMQREALALCK